MNTRPSTEQSVDPQPARLRRLPVLGNAPEPTLPAIPSGQPIHDGLNRPITYLRISLTDRCNYRCTYCMPEEGVELALRSQVLSFEELETVVQALMRVGVRRVRLTGGEPTVRKDLLHLVERLGRLGLDDLALSTNGERLAELAGPLRQAGLDRLNVSLDTLDAAKFRQVTRHGHLDRVLAGLEAVRSAGFKSTKLNTVAMRGFNDDEVGALCRYAFERGFVPRFIELMPMAEGSLFYPGTFFPVAETRTILRHEFGALLDEQELPAESRPSAQPGVGPARYAVVSYQGAVHRVGLISAVSEPFCDTCNRVRLSATGELHACLAYDDAIDLRSVLRAHTSQSPDELLNVLAATARTGLQRKRLGHEFTPSGCGGPRKYMVSIGG